MKAPAVITVDFETEAIQSRPKYPPIPVGFSLYAADIKPIYYAWGHPTGNNTTKAQALRVLRTVWKDPRPKVFQNAKFDVEVAEEHLDMPPLPWDKVHDTLYLVFLMDPHARSLSLKPSAERVLGIKPKERDALRAWILENVPEARAKPAQWGAYISRAPGGLVGRYAAQGDAVMTLRLFRHLYPQVVACGMQPAYDRERRLMPILLANERVGLRVHEEALDDDIPTYDMAMERVDGYLRKALKTPELNIDSNADLVEALLRTGKAQESDFIRTAPSKRFPAGQMSVSKESLAGAIRDPKLLSALGYHTRLTTVLGTFMKPWASIAAVNKGRIHTQWHQVRGEDHGARTGRIISSDPNLLNLSKTFEGRGDGFIHPAFISDLPPLPLVRLYILPDKGEEFIHRDYDQQELRILAHFEDGALLEQYRANPNLDVHDWTRDEIRRVVGLNIQDRTRIKTLNFGDIYGMGVQGLVAKLKCSHQEATELKNAKKRAMPGVEDLKRSLKETAQAGEPIRTWGGRLYYVEAPQIIDDRMRTFEYKLLNYLIQGSAADITKEAVIRYHDLPNREGRFLVTVYDEVNGSAPKKAAKEELLRYRTAMESVELDLPMLSSAKRGSSWGALTKVEEKR